MKPSPDINEKELERQMRHWLRYFLATVTGPDGDYNIQRRDGEQLAFGEQLALDSMMHAFETYLTMLDPVPLGCEAPWEMEKRGFVWYAINENGQGNFFSHEPVPYDPPDYLEDGWWRYQRGGFTERGKQHPTLQPDGSNFNWKATLQKRRQA